MTEVIIRFLGDIRALSRPNFLLKGFGLPADTGVAASLVFVGAKCAKEGGGGKWN